MSALESCHDRNRVMYTDVDAFINLCHLPNKACSIQYFSPDYLPPSFPPSFHTHLNVALPPPRPSSSISKSYCCPPLPPLLPPPSTDRCKRKSVERRVCCQCVCDASMCVCLLALLPLCPSSGLARRETYPSSSLTLATTLPSTQVSGPASATHTEAPTSMLLRLLLLE